MTQQVGCDSCHLLPNAISELATKSETSFLLGSGLHRSGEKPSKVRRVTPKQVQNACLEGDCWNIPLVLGVWLQQTRFPGHCGSDICFSQPALQMLFLLPFLYLPCLCKLNDIASHGKEMEHQSPKTLFHFLSCDTRIKRAASLLSWQ